MHPLAPLGWSDILAAAFEPHRRADPTLRPARVSQEHRESWRVLLAPGEERLAVPAGRLRHEGALPAVGDFVSVAAPPGDGSAVIRALLPRRTALVRKQPERSIAAQVLAANVDTVFVAIPLDRGLHPGLVDRALALAWDGGADPVVVLMKSDLVPDPEAAARAAATACPAAPIVAVSAATGAGIDALAPWLVAGRTVALLGPSGAGKSTLVNRLLGTEAMETGEVRDLDQRGRHTTVHRHLLPVPGGAVLVDTPGLREVALFGAEEGIGAAFADIEEIAARCRFTDCRHGTEPRCAVRAAVGDGTLDPARLESWRKLLREEAHLARKLGVEPAWQAKHQRRAWGRMVKDALARKQGLRDGRVDPTS